MTTKFFLLSAALAILTCSSSSFAEDQYVSPEIHLNAKTTPPKKIKNDDWNSEYRVNAKPSKTRGVASEPDAPEKIESMSARYPSSVNEDGIHTIKTDEQPVAPIFWKYKPEE